jgi:hypothetical protein
MPIDVNPFLLDLVPDGGGGGGGGGGSGGGDDNGMTSPAALFGGGVNKFTTFSSNTSLSGTLLFPL